jgi:hypothetical protein
MSSKGGAETYRLTTPVLIVSWRFTDDRSAYPAIVNVLVDRMPSETQPHAPLEPNTLQSRLPLWLNDQSHIQAQFFSHPHLARQKKKKPRGTIQVYVAR